MSGPASTPPVRRDTAEQALDDALWLADLETPEAWDTYECGHGATYAMPCPWRCKAWRRMVRLHDYLHGGSRV